MHNAGFKLQLKHQRYIIVECLKYLLQQQLSVHNEPNHILNQKR